MLRTPEDTAYAQRALRTAMEALIAVDTYSFGDGPEAIQAAVHFDRLLQHLAYVRQWFGNYGENWASRGDFWEG